MKITKLDNAFSIFIRLRDRLPNSEMIRCISCGKLVHWKESDCGHYINRKHLSVRFNEQNCNAQCRSCNRFDEGNIAGYTIGLQNKYGYQIVQKLLLGKSQTVKFSQKEIDELTKFYKQKIKEMQ